MAWTGLVQSFGRNGRRGKGRGQSNMRLGRGCAPSCASGLSFVCAPVNWKRGGRRRVWVVCIVCRWVGIASALAPAPPRATPGPPIEGTPFGRSLCERAGSYDSIWNAEVNRERAPLGGRWAAGAASCGMRVWVWGDVALRPVGTLS